MNLLIVDDDQTLLDTIPAAYSWEQWGITSVKTAASVSYAKEILKKQDTDILLCDIEMPMETGIDLLEWMTNEIFPSIAVIFLTCHSEFNYLQRALQLGCSNYLLKPVEEQELREAILDAEEKVVKIRKEDKYNSNRKKGNREAFWEDVVTHRINSRFLLSQICNDYKIPDTEDIYIVMVKLSNHSYKVKDMSKSLMSFALENLLRELLKDTEYAMINTYNERLWLFFKEEIPENLTDILTQAIEWVKEEYFSSLTCYLGKKINIITWENEYNRLMRADDEFAGSGRVYTSSQIEHRHFIPIHMPETIEANILELFAQKDYRNLLQKMEGYFSSIPYLQCSSAALSTICHHLNHEFEKLLGSNEKEIFSETQLSLYQANPDCMKSIPGMLEHYEQLFEKLEEDTNSFSQESAVDKAKLYIAMNMQSDIKREDVAQAVGFHPDYLNRIFKKETGSSLKDYIADRKIEMACELLEQSDFHIGEIGEMIGYVNFSSFTTFFKNRTGVTPASWRKSREK